MKKNYFIIILVLSFCSCQKEKPNTVESPEDVDVYVVGFVSDDANYHNPRSNPYNNGVEHPAYWKNGNPVQLDYGDFLGIANLKSGRALSIAVSGNNVYVVGYGTRDSYINGVFPYGVFWKNGISVDRDSMNLWSTYMLYSLAVSNDDNYMTGWESVINAAYWKNENRIALTPAYSPTTLNIRATTSSIAVSGKDVYVSGYQSEQLSPVGGWSKVFAMYWKNGNPVKLTDGSEDANATAIAVAASDVYVAGTQGGNLIQTNNGSFVYDRNPIAKYWKNGTAVNLTDGSTAADANSIAVSGTDVYVAGTQWDGNSIQYNDGYMNYNRNPIAKYWKNGKPVNLTDGSKWAEARSIVLTGNDVYVAGFEDGVAKYWKNGSPVILGDASKYSEAYSIFLAKK